MTDSDLPDWLPVVPAWVKGLAVTVATLGAGVTGWGAMGWPVPLTTAAHDVIHAREDAIELLEGQIEFTQKIVDRTEEGSTERAEAEHNLAALRAQLAGLEE